MMYVVVFFGFARAAVIALLILMGIGFFGQ